MSEPTSELSRLEILVLARLSGFKKPPSENDIAATLERIAVPHASKGEWRSRVAGYLGTLRERSLIDGRRALTDAGKRALASALGLHAAPDWRAASTRHLPAIAAGMDAGGDHGMSGERLRAALLASHLGMPVKNRVLAVIDDAVISELGLAPGALTLDKVRAHVLARRAGVDAKGKAADIATRLVARSVRAPNARNLHAALVQRWLAGEAVIRAALPSNGNQAAPVVKPAMTPPAMRPLDDGSFAAMVNDTAHRIGQDGRFGDHKVFVSAIWRNLEPDLRRHGMGLDDLKRRLVDANRAGLLSLARADLVGAMNPEEVRLSEILDRGASFHFVVDNTRLS